VDEYVDWTEDGSGADLAALAREAALLAVREYVQSGAPADDHAAIPNTRVTGKHLEQAYERVSERGTRGSSGR
jgi:SpoVK/Ycf46/Vps4 family AAA+-type ATPase